MTTIAKWQYDEMKYSGVNFNDPSIASEYDEKFKKFQDYEETAHAIMQAVNLKEGSTVMDIGCGTGLFVLHAARRCRKVYALDVSNEMLNICRSKANEQGLDNIVFCQAGFLTYEHNDEPLDTVVSMKALHHLPDFWKSAALLRIKQMLKPQGNFYLEDLVYSFDPCQYSTAISQWIEDVTSIQGKDFAPRMETAIRQEYKTFNWILEGLLERSGFEIEQGNYIDNYRATYLCTKIHETE